MNRCRTEDYTAVLQAMVQLMHDTPRVHDFVMDFEAALWAAVRNCFPGSSIHGCVFHWTQSVWRKTQGLGLQQAYQEDERTHRLIRLLLALPFLPQEHIQPAFNILEPKANQAPALRELFQYVRDFWVLSTTFPPVSWSVFRRTIRTNNDAEGWHRRLNYRAQKGSLPFYLLVQLLRKEAALVTTEVTLVRAEQVRRHHRQAFRDINGKLEACWEKFAKDPRHPFRLLKSCAGIYAPALETE